MKVFLKNGLIKKLLIVFITIVMISNFIMPNYAFAKNKDGNKLVNGFFYLLAWGGDAILKLMQKTMMGTADIIENDAYAIKYSPGIIFSNTVPALDIDFIGANSSYNDTVNRKYTDVEDEDEIVELIEKSNINKDNFTLIENLFELRTETMINEAMKNEALNYGLVIDYHSASMEGDLSSYTFQTIGNGAIFYGTFTIKKWRFAENKVGKILSDDVGLGDKIVIWLYGSNLYKIEYLDSKTLNIYSCPVSNLAQDVETIELDSVAYKLQSNISTWYNALRTIALVGLLSVLVYIGIRIILSSASAQDKAKYKNMLKDWLVAICILFVLHYFMAFMLNLTNSLNEIIKNNAISSTDVGNNTDELMNTIRTTIGDIEQDTTTNMAGYTIMYLALVILTGIFTVQYLKRVVFMAFLTMIAPMIALTYPLDKIKDGKAQAFSYWMREYIFNCLIQPVHLLLYTILITNAMDFAKTNVLYAIVALAFMVPAEKFIKEMFGMKSSSPTGQLGAAAGGAVVMSMINKMRGIKPPKDAPDGNGGGAPNGIRTPNSTRTANVNNSTNNNNQNNNNNNNNNNNQNYNNQNNNNNNQNNNNNNNNQNSNRNQNNSSNTSISGSTSWRRWKSIRGVNSLASAGGRLSRVTGGILGGVAAGTVGLAAQVADGDLFDNPTKAFTDAATAVGVGAVAGNNLVGQGVRLERNIREWGEKKALGIDEYNNMQFDGKFYKSDAYKSIEQDAKVEAMCKAAGIKTKNAVQSFLDSGVTDANKIKEALQNGIGGVTYKAYSDSGVSDVDKMSKMSNAGITPQIYKEQYKDKGIDDVSKILKLKKKYPNLSDDGIANRMAIAKDAPKSQQQFIPWAKAKFRNLDDAGAEALYKTIVDFF